MMTSRSFVVGLLALGSSLSMGCSEAVPPAAKGATYVAFSTAGNCAVGKPHNGRIGYVTTTEVRDFAVDTVAGAQVFCKVTPAGNGFSAEGFITLGTTHLDFAIDEISDANNEANQAKGALSYSHVETVKGYTTPNDEPCNFWVGANGQGVKPGELWIDFQCPVIQAASIDSTCGIATGSTLAMTDCEM